MSVSRYLLTREAFKFSITTMLPTISYMTILDKYTRFYGRHRGCVLSGSRLFCAH